MPAFAGGVAPRFSQQPGAGFVRVRAQPLGPGGVVPRVSVQPGAGFVRVGAKPVVAAAQPTPASPTPAAPSPSGPTQPFALPAGAFNPQRQVEVEEANRGLEQLQGEDATAATRDVSDYNTALAQLQQSEQQQGADHATNLATIARAFQNLKTAQEQKDNAAGVVSGGALLQAAAKRSSNEGLETAKQNTAFERQQLADQAKAAELARELAPPPEAGSLDPTELAQGGRKFQDIGTALSNAALNNAFFGESQNRLAGQEAAENGYVPPTAPLVRAAAAPSPRVSAQPGAGYVRVGATPKPQRRGRGL